VPELLENPGLLVFWVVAISRFLVPLTIPRYPLPGILASLILDAVDQTIFQQFPGLELEGYQGYDKALDIYYLTIAYISTLRNWKNKFAFQVSRFLFYWRLVGVALFELTQLRVLLLVFPNTFEYFFIFYEAYRLRWDPQQMSKKFVIGAAALIWIVIKLPQEYWIHIGQIDTTDWIKTGLFGVPVNTSWSQILQTWPVVCLGGLILISLILVAVWLILKQRLPPADRKLAFAADAHQPAFTTAQVRQAIEVEARIIVDAALGEKIILVSLVSLCFAQVLSGVVATNLQVAASVTFVVILNTALSHWSARRGFGWAFTTQQFVLLALVNSLALLIYSLLRAMLGESVIITNAIFYVLLFSLIITLYDRFRQVYLMRFSHSGRSHPDQPSPGAEGNAGGEGDLNNDPASELAEKR
jgi:hypothetical protein